MIPIFTCSIYYSFANLSCSQFSRLAKITSLGKWPQLFGSELKLIASLGDALVIRTNRRLVDEGGYHLGDARDRECRPVTCPWNFEIEALRHVFGGLPTPFRRRVGVVFGR